MTQEEAAIAQAAGQAEQTAGGEPSPQAAQDWEQRYRETQKWANQEHQTRLSLENRLAAIEGQLSQQNQGAPSPVAGAEMDLYPIIEQGPRAFADAIAPHLQGRYLTADQAMQLVSMAQQRAVVLATWLMKNPAREDPVFQDLVGHRLEALSRENPQLDYLTVLNMAEEQVRGTKPTVTPSAESSAPPASPVLEAPEGVAFPKVAEGGSTPSRRGPQPKLAPPTSEEQTEEFVDNWNRKPWEGEPTEE